MTTLVTTSSLPNGLTSEACHDIHTVTSEPPSYHLSQALHTACNTEDSTPNDNTHGHAPEADLLPSYGADAPPYFPETPLDPFLCVFRRPGWEDGDLSSFARARHDTWAQDYAVLTAELRSWELAEDPNSYLRMQMRDPAGWTGVSECDVQWVETAFPPGIRNTALSLRSSVQLSLMCDAEFNSDLMDAIRVTLDLGVYRKPAPFRPIRYYLPSRTTPGRMSGYDGSWMLAALGPHLAVALGELLIPQLHYTHLVKALFVMQCRHKFVLDARKLIEERQKSVYWRWKRQRRLRAVREGPVDGADNRVTHWFAALSPWNTFHDV